MIRPIPFSNAISHLIGQFVQPIRIVEGRNLEARSPSHPSCPTNQVTSFPPLWRPVPKIIRAEKVRDLTPSMAYLEQKVQESDQRPSDDYRLDRDLEYLSGLTADTAMGRLEDNISKRIKHSAEPVRLLALGPGKGNLEDALKRLFGRRIEIDGFSLTDTLSQENRHSFRRLYLGNFDVCRFPEGYDLVISSHGVEHALDIVWVFDQVVSSLEEGGEAFFNYDVQRGELPPVTEEGMTAYLLEQYGLFVGCLPKLIQKTVYIRKTKDIPSIEALKTELAQSEPRPPRRYYRLNESEPFKPLDQTTLKEEIRSILLALVGKDRGTYYPGERLEGAVSRMAEITWYASLRVGFTLEQAVQEYDHEWGFRNTRS